MAPRIVPETQGEHKPYLKEPYPACSTVGSTPRIKEEIFCFIGWHGPSARSKESFWQKAKQLACGCSPHSLRSRGPEAFIQQGKQKDHQSGKFWSRGDYFVSEDDLVLPARTPNPRNYSCEGRVGGATDESTWRFVWQDLVPRYHECRSEPWFRPLRFLLNRVSGCSFLIGANSRCDPRYGFSDCRDLPLMWIRDSAFQIGSLIPRINRRPALRSTVEGGIRLQAFYIIQVSETVCAFMCKSHREICHADDWFSVGSIRKWLLSRMERP